jgi:hypothetical protein
VERWRLDLEGDGVQETVQFLPRSEPCLRVFRRGRLVWQGGKRIWHAWKLQLIDLDEDRLCEFVVGVHKGTRFYPPQRSIHVLGWNGRYAYRKWMGSRLAGALYDFALCRFTGHTPVRLVTVERDREGRPRLRVYRWSGFGFVVLWQSEPLPDTGTLSPHHRTVSLRLAAKRYRLTSPPHKEQFSLKEE